MTETLARAAATEARHRQWFLRAATVLTTLLTVAFVYIMVASYYRIRVPATDWFEVTKLQMPDHASGSNPTLIYGQTVKTDFRGEWVIEYVRKEGDGWFAVCSNNGVLAFTPADTFAEVELTLMEFMERLCTVTPGQYRLRASIVMDRALWPPKSYTTMSNTFEVTEQ